ncbi:SDR family oxidoreductase [Anaerofustis sp.]|uniref:SDR family NAD(P)-dependent oxidoreductase n=1 Tax=Anaerofustis sp. TaxID=1872517 RepID=UPI0025BB4703|nr:SDR family oxidoreductase [Anaerofustis sp.]
MKENRPKALVTGASSGIGKDIAIELSKKGYDIILVSRNTKALEKVKLKIQTNAEIVAMDLSQKENCYELYNKYKNIDILINNAGLGDCGYFTETDVQKEIAMIDTNITAVHILSKLYIKNMKKKNKGIILNTASIAGFMPGPLMATYYATKAYVVRLSEAIREELKKEKSKVQISILCPGPVDTKFNEVANVQFALQGLSSNYVAQYTVKKMLKGKFYIVPGWKIKVIRIGVKILPTSLISKISYKVQRRKVIL